MPKGLIRCTRHISRKYEHEVDFALARLNSSGRSVLSRFSSFGNYHINTSQGPRPVSLFEVSTRAPNGIPLDVAIKLHSISIGFPLVGEYSYSSYEKFYNPVVKAPEDIPRLLLQLWLSPDGSLRNEDRLSRELVDYTGQPLGLPDSILFNRLNEIIDTFPGETSACGWTDHPKSGSVRRDRGR